jgi:ATP-binding cassette subfamily B (MDR/TAP) protein 1
MSAGTLTARVSRDPVQIQQLLGMNIGLVFIAILNVLGSTIIAFYFGWKLTLVAVFVAMPLIIASGIYRVYQEIQFDSLDQGVFTESSKFASEAIGAFRTVASLTIEDLICRRYKALLAEHVKQAIVKGRLSSLVFAASDSIPLLCMALTFWYGGQLLATHEYNPLQFFAVYIAVILGCEGAGQWLSFGSNIAQATASANRILSMRPRLETIQSGQVELRKKEGGMKIELRNLWFQYPTRDVPVFTGLNIKVSVERFPI